MRDVSIRAADASNEIGEGEAEFLRNVMRGYSITSAATKAGYSESSGYTIIRRPHVAAIVTRSCLATLRSQLAPKALLALDQLVDEANKNDRTRLDAAKTILQHAYKDDETGRGGQSKPISEMSADELKRAVEQGQRELANRSTKVLDAEGNAQGDAQTEVKSLDLLD